MELKNVKGLKFPDEYFIKFFFKNGLHRYTNKTFLELGCSNGCNLSLPYLYGNHVIGVDFNQELIDFAQFNFKSLNQDNNFSFTCEDMRTFVKNKNHSVDVLVLANSVYYIPKNDFIQILKDIKKTLKKDIPLFIRFRALEDYRYGKGEEVDKDAFIINNGITGEDGAFCKFYSKEEMIALLEKEINLKDYEVMNIAYENIQNKQLVTNKEIVIWGKINS